MNITFHVLLGFTETVFIAKTMKDPDSDKLYQKGDWIPIAVGFVLGVFTHGLVDWIYHRYPIPAIPDVLIAGVLWIGIPFLLKRRWWLIYAFTSLGNVIPDLIDHGIQALNFVTDTGLKQITVFPWHRREISSDLFHEFPYTSQILHVIVIILISVSLLIGFKSIFRKNLPNLKQSKTE